MFGTFGDVTAVVVGVAQLIISRMILPTSLKQ